MAITPSGTPAWTRAAAHTDYGGNVNKTNYMSRGVIDALTDVGAEAITRIAADLEAVSRVAPFASFNITCNDSTSAAPTVNSAYMMTGVRTTSYEGDSPATGYPSVARNGDGDVTVTFAASYSDPYGVAGTFTPRHAFAGAGSAIPVVCTASVTGSTVRVRCFDGSGTPLVAMAGAVFDLAVW